jgi:quinohemoprotein amine dehydrogenase
MLRSVLLLNADWDTFTGRLFTGEYNELGMDVTLHRRTERPQIFHVDGGALRTPSTGNRVDLIGEGFSEDLSAQDLYAGDRVTITELDRITEHLVQLKVDIAEGAEHGRRFFSVGADRGPAGILIHDGIDYIKVTPGEGLARVGGKMRPPMFERFEAVGMNRGKDGKRWTKDDVEVRVVPATWSIEEFPIREGDDDAQFVGSIDPETGLFTPGVDGPNPERKWSANNIGDVYVVASCTLEAPVRSDKKEEEREEESRGGSSRWSRDSGDRGESDDGEEEEGEDAEEEPEEPEESEEDAPLVYAEQEFRARGHLVVTVQVYVKWDTYQMNQR